MVLAQEVQQAKARAATVSIVSNSILIILKLVVGIMMQSVSVISEAVHSGLDLVAAIIALDLLGILGVILAAPILATLQFLGRYVMRKMFDLDPWEGLEEMPQPPSLQQQFASGLAALRTKLKLR